jgi:tripartite-type tricarboxylate transporter receptor subunit TctC
MGHLSAITRAALLAASVTATATAQDYPSRPVRIIVPFGAGGTADIFGRQLGQHLSEAWKQPFIIENRTGAGGNVGTDAAAKSAPDGYTLLMVGSTHATNESLYKNKPFVLMRDFAAVAPLNYFDMVMVVTPSLPANSVRELIALAREKPGTLNFASSGLGTNYHMAGELFKSMAKLDIVHVPYKEAGAARLGVMSGQVQMMFDGIGTQVGNIAARKVKPLATMGSKRAASLSGVPTMDEAGVPGYEVLAWNGVMVPKGTPAAIVDKLNAEIVRFQALPGIKENWAKQGVAPIVMGVAEFDRFVRAEIDKWAEVVRVSGARAD